MPLIVSWDVGVKNLAYCMMELNKSTFRIHEWNKINLMEDEIDSCNNCDSEAKWKYESNTNTKYYCNKHKKISNVLLPTDKRQRKTYSCDKIFVNDKKQCTNEIKYCIINKDKKKYYCNTHKPNDYCTLKKVKKIGANKMPIEILQRNLLEKLDSMTNLLKAEIIVIENQPSLKNPKMKSIASTIFDFYLMRSTIDRDIVDTRINKVVYQNPSNKLKLDENNSLILAKTNKKEKYKMTKDLAVIYTKKLLSKDKKQLEMLSKIKKIDDLCDCFLQGCYYLTHKV